MVKISLCEYWHSPIGFICLILSILSFFMTKEKNTWEHCLCVDGMVYVLVVFTKEYFGCLILLLCYSPKTGLMILELDRQPRKPSISCLFTPHSVGCTDTFSHPQFFVNREWNLSPHSKWFYPVSHLLRHKLLSNWFHLLCLCFSLMCSHGLLSTCSFNFEVFSKSF